MEYLQSFDHFKNMNPGEYYCVRLFDYMPVNGVYPVEIMKKIRNKESPEHGIPLQDGVITKRIGIFWPKKKSDHP